MRAELLRSSAKGWREKGEDVETTLLIQEIKNIASEVNDPLIESMVDDVITSIPFESKAKVITSTINRLRKFQQHPQKVKIKNLGLLIGKLAVTKYGDNAFFLAVYTTSLIHAKRGSEVIPLITDFFDRVPSSNLTESDIIHLTINLSSGYKTLGKYNEGISCLEALNSKPENVGRSLAELYYYVSNYGKVITVAEAYMPINHQMAKWYAKALHKLGKENEALAAIEPFKDFPEIKQLKEELLANPSLISTKPISKLYASNKRVFVVHGHDGEAKQSVARFLERLKVQPVILTEQPDEGRTIIEKFEKHSDVSFAVVLLTADDLGHPVGKPGEAKPRARQNVILELGYFVGKLTRNRVCALCRGAVEIPSDYHGVLYIPMDDQGGWKLRLASEMKQASVAIDLSDLL